MRAAVHTDKRRIQRDSDSLPTYSAIQSRTHSLDSARRRASLLPRNYDVAFCEPRRSITKPQDYQGDLRVNNSLSIDKRQEARSPPPEYS